MTFLCTPGGFCAEGAWFSSMRKPSARGPVASARAAPAPRQHRPASDGHLDAAFLVPQYSWGGRFSQQMDALVARFNASVSFDQRLARHDIAGSKAHARMLASVDLLSAAELRSERHAEAQQQQRSALGLLRDHHRAEEAEPPPASVYRSCCISVECTGPIAIREWRLRVGPVSQFCGTPTTSYLVV